MMFYRMSKILSATFFLFVSIAVFSASSKTFNVMAPLQLPAWYYSIRTGQDYINGGTLTAQNKAAYQQDIAYFQQQIAAAKAIGVNAVSTDVWWGMVEGSGDQQFVWDDYKNIFQDIANAGLQIQAIMSFHQCGGNIGDDVNVPLPSWIWSVAGNGAKYIPEQLYTNGNGTAYPLNPTIPSHTVNTLLSPEQEATFGDPEVVALWATNNSAVHKQYQEFISAFATFVNQNGFADDMQAINISCGPSGECRFPSYDTYTVTSNGVSYNIGAGWPSRGFLMCFSANAFAAFQNAMQQKYGTIDALNQAWSTSLSSFNDVTPPTNGDAFFQYAVQTPRPQYAIDFINWYNGCLIQHGQEMLTDALIALGSDAGQLQTCTVENKIPGITWQMGSSSIPRSAEICAGLIPGSFQQDVYNFGCGPAVTVNGQQTWNDASCGQDYSGLLKMVYGMNTNSNNTTKHFVQLYFTCLEQPNMDYQAQGYSWPATLVYCIGQEANQIGLTVKGENALAPNNGWGYANGGLNGIPIGNQYWGLNSNNANSSNTSAYSWSVLLYAMSNANYQGINILRVENLTTEGQGMYGNFYGLIYYFNQGNPGVPATVPQISTWNVGPVNTN